MAGSGRADPAGALGDQGHQLHISEPKMRRWHGGGISQGDLAPTCEAEVRTARPRRTTEGDPSSSRLVRPRRASPPRPSISSAISHQIVPPPSDEATGQLNTMVIGRVVGVHIDESVLMDGRVDVTRFKPLSRLGYFDYATVEGRAGGIGRHPRQVSPKPGGQDSVRRPAASWRMAARRLCRTMQAAYFKSPLTCVFA